MLKLKLKLAAVLIIAVLLVFFVLQNMVLISVKFFLFGPVIVPLAYLLCASVLFGMVLMGLGFLARTLRLKGIQKRVIAQQEALRQISQNLVVQRANMVNMSGADLLPPAQSQPQFPSAESSMGNAPVQRTVYGNNATSSSSDAQKSSKRKAKPERG